MSSGNATLEQIEANYKRAFYCTWTVSQYHAGLEVLEKIWNGGGDTTATSFSAVINEIYVTATVQVANFAGTVNSVDSPVGGTSGGTVNALNSMQDLFTNTASFTYCNDGIMVIYFLDKNDSIIGLYAGGAISGMNPYKGSATGAWTLKN